MYKRYSIKRALIFSLIIMLLTTLFRVFASILYLTTESETVRSIMENGNILTLIMHLTCLILPCVIYIHFVIPKGEVKETLRFNKFSFKNLVYVICILLLFQPFISLISYISSLFFYDVATEVLVETMEMPYILSLMFIAVLPAISEELVFRGIVLSNCNDDHDLIFSMLNGLLFGTVHGNFSQFFYAFFLGMLFYYIVKISNSIYLVMIAHFLINGSQVTLMYLAYSGLDAMDIADLSQATDFDLQVLVILIAISILSLGVLSFVWRSFKRYNSYNTNTI